VSGDRGSLTQRKPDWLRIRPPSGENFKDIRKTLRKHNLATVCEEAHCPNINECWGGGTATIMLMGEVCTRGCRFCMVTSGQPASLLDPLEPYKVANVLKEWDLEYIVLTSVARDDLPDEGSGHFAKTVEVIKQRVPEMLVEILIPDFKGRIDALQNVVDAKPDVIAHNIETTERLTPTVRDVRANYRQTLDVLANIKKLDATRYSKSAIMLGLGETEDEVIQTMRDLRSVGCDFLTIGQYLRPSKKHLEVQEYVTPEQFDRYQQLGMEEGFLYVASGPLVRSSYRAGEFFIKSLLKRVNGGDTNGKEHSDEA
jgi:lipoic acid synthetase